MSAFLENSSLLYCGFEVTMLSGRIDYLLKAAPSLVADVHMGPLDLYCFMVGLICRLHTHTDSCALYHVQICSAKPELPARTQPQLEFCCYDSVEIVSSFQLRVMCDRDRTFLNPVNHSSLHVSVR